MQENKYQFIVRLLKATFGCALSSSLALSQPSASTDSKTMLDPAPMISPRANGVSGALSTSADNFDAFYYNPAGIGGQTYDGKSEKEPFVRQILFPKAAVTINENATKLNSEFSSSGATSNANAGATIIKAHDQKRQYARVSIAPVGLFLGGLGIVPVIDQQIAAIPRDTPTSDVEFRYRTFSGILVGSSFSHSKGYFSLGASSTLGTYEETYVTAPYIDIVDQPKRSDLEKANKKTYSAKGFNAGAIIRAPHKLNPSISLVARDMGGSRHQSIKDSGDPLMINEDLTAGFGIAPSLGKFARLNLALECGYLTDKHQATKKKLRSGLELTLGHENGSRALFGLRAGGTSAGASYGAHINLGLIGLEASSYAVDIGIDNERLIERRTSAAVYIDVASF
ncbi:MAG: hypothetical protein NTV34_21765 [Proteobacteria bacterium]|nr:hypothetical protein [Pseudomonadota bacterium]